MEKNKLNQTLIIKDIGSNELSIFLFMFMFVGAQTSCVNYF